MVPNNVQLNITTHKVCIATFDDGKANAVDPTWVDALESTVAFARDNKAQALVLRGRARYFSAGLNLKVVPGLSPDDFRDFSFRYSDLILDLLELSIPTIAVVEGHALAAGAVALLACDYRIGLRGDYKVGLNETQIGLPLPTFCLEIARSKLGDRAMHVGVLEGNSFAPDAAREIGYLTDVVDPESFEDDLEQTITRVRMLAGEAYATTKKRMYAKIVAEGKISARAEFEAANRPI